MIDICLRSIHGRLNEYLQGLFSVSDDLVVLSPLADAEGAQAAETRNRVAMFLLNISQDTVPRQRPTPNSPETQYAPPMHLDIHFMLAAAHDPDLYAEGLKQISAAMMFFQAHPLLTPRNLPTLPPQVSQLSIEMVNLRIEELSQLWSNLGGRYVPSVTYKMRTAIIDSGTLVRVDPLITRRETRVEPAGTA
ncbi:MAG: DUF4255 domain-containing protein [Paracoccus sp. (in: a-proteobacteria)]